MRKPKPQGKNKRPHGANCGVCAKPKAHRKRQALKEYTESERAVVSTAMDILFKHFRIPFIIREQPNEESGIR